MRGTMKNKTDVFDVKLDPEEQALLDSVESGEWQTVENSQEEQVFAKEAAANYLHKDT